MLPNIAARAFNTPLLVAPRKAVAFAHGLGARVLGQPVAFLDDDEGDAPPAARRPFASLIGNEMAEQVEPGYGYGLIENVAIVSISGVLVHRGAWIGQSSGQSSYEGIRAQLDAVAENPAVRAIALEFDSFGGEVAGCFDLADRIRAIAARKPVRAFIVEHSYSAAYALAAQAGKIVLPRTGFVGSIGVLCMHVDMSGALDKAGLVATLIHAGAHKIDANPYEPLPKAVLEEMTTELEVLRALFAETVAKGRGDRLGAEAALATEARCFMGEAAVAAGLADAVAEPRAAFLDFLAEVRAGGGAVGLSTINGARGARLSPPASTGEKSMAKTLAAQTAEDEDPDPEDEHDERGASTEEDETEGDPDEEKDEEKEDTPADKKAAGAERERIAAILTSEAAAGREELARHLALETDMSPKAALAILSASPSIGVAGGGQLAQAMRAQGGVRAPAVPGAGAMAPKLSAAEQMKARVARR